jgi:hypothetical protein
MVLNKRGVIFFYTLMLGLTIIVFGLAMASPIRSFIDDARTNMTCSLPANNWDEAMCWILDLMKPMVTGGIILVGVAVMSARIWIS